MPADGKATVGTPITVTITESATGLGDASLPEPSLPALDGAEVYPDKTQGTTDDDGQWLKATRQRKFAIVPTRPGPLRIPAIAVDWWNVQADKRATATIPAHTLQVSGSAAAGARSAPSVTTPATAASVIAPAPGQGPNAGPPQAVQQPAYWRWLSFAFAALWLLTLIGFGMIWRRRATNTPGKTEVIDTPDITAARRRFRAAKNVEAQGRGLLAWAQAERPGIRNLGELAARLDDETQRRLLRQLQQARFDERVAEPDLAAVRQAFHKGLAWRQAEKPDAREEILPPLYPRR